jgi:hypothetical protein
MCGVLRFEAGVRDANVLLMDVPVTCLPYVASSYAHAVWRGCSAGHQRGGCYGYIYLGPSHYHSHCLHNTVRRAVATEHLVGAAESSLAGPLGVPALCLCGLGDVNSRRPEQRQASGRVLYNIILTVQHDYVRREAARAHAKLLMRIYSEILAVKAGSVHPCCVAFRLAQHGTGCCMRRGSCCLGDQTDQMENGTMMGYGELPRCADSGATATGVQCRLPQRKELARQPVGHAF